MDFQINEENLWIDVKQRRKNNRTSLSGRCYNIIWTPPANNVAPLSCNNVASAVPTIVKPKPVFRPVISDVSYAEVCSFGLTIQAPVVASPDLDETFATEAYKGYDGCIAASMKFNDKVRLLKKPNKNLRWLKKAKSKETPTATNGRKKESYVLRLDSSFNTFVHRKKLLKPHPVTNMSFKNYKIYKNYPVFATTASPTFLSNSTTKYLSNNTTEKCILYCNNSFTNLPLGTTSFFHIMDSHFKENDVFYEQEKLYQKWYEKSFQQRKCKIIMSDKSKLFPYNVPDEKLKDSKIVSSNEVQYDYQKTDVKYQTNLKLNIEVINGTESNMFEVEDDWMVLVLVCMVEAWWKIERHAIYLSYGSKPLNEILTLDSYDITSKSRIFVNFRLQGGALEETDQKQAYVQDVSNHSNQYLNFNLNSINKHSTSTPVQSRSKSSADNKFASDIFADNHTKKRKPQSWKNSSKLSNITTSTKMDEKIGDKKRRKNDSNSPQSNVSTLTLHITAYENSVDRTTASVVKERKDFSKLIFIGLTDTGIFEFPRQQENQNVEPEVVQYIANQQLLNPNALVPYQRMVNPLEEIDNILTRLGLPNVFNAFNNGNNAAEDALRRLEELVAHANTRIQFMYLFDQFMNTRSAKLYRPRREFYVSTFYFAYGYTPTQAENLLLTVGHRFERPTRTNWALYTPEVLMIALRVLRTGCDFWSAGYFIGPSRATAHRCFWQFIDAVNAELGHLITLRGTEAQWMHHATVVWNEHDISNVIGFIDGSYIPIRNIGDENIWICRKNYPAINLTIFVDSSGLIRFASCRWSGRMHDINVYRNTALAHEIRTGVFAPFPGAVILGDSAYIGADRMILAHPRTANIPPHENEFWRCHREARSLIERVFGQLKGKFGILSRKKGFMNFQSRRSCSEVIRACCYLFNFSLHQNGFADESEDHVYFRDLDPNLTPAEDLIAIYNEEQHGD